MRLQNCDYFTRIDFEYLLIIIISCELIHYFENLYISMILNALYPILFTESFYHAVCWWWSLKQTIQTVAFLKNICWYVK